MKRLAPVLFVVAAAACQCGEETTIAYVRLEVSPSILDFGGVPVGTTERRILQLKSAGNAQLTLDSVAFSDGGENLGFALEDVATLDCDGFTRLRESPVPGGGCVTTGVVFTPKKDGPVSAKIRVISDDPSHPTIDVTVTGDGLPATIGACLVGPDDAVLEDTCTKTNEEGAFVVPAIDFGETPRRSTVTRKVRISSVGRATLALSKIGLSQGAVGFALPDAPGTADVLGGKTLDVVVAYTPPRAGEFAGKLVLESNDAEHPTVEIPLSGKGTAPAVKVCVLALDGSLDEAACTRLDETPAFKPIVELPQTPLAVEVQRSVRILNVGPAPLSLVSTELQATTPELSVPLIPDAQAIAPGAWVDVPFAFLPRHEGAAAGLFAITTDDDAHPRIELEVKAFAISAIVQICALREDGTEAQDACSRLRDTPPFVPDVDFGLGGWGAHYTRKLRIRNTGLAPMNLARMTLTTQVVDLTLAGGYDAGVLGPGEQRDVELAFDPRAEGAVSGTLQVVTNDVESPVVTVNVKGNAEGPKLCVEPADKLEFGTVPMNTTRMLSLVARNCGIVPFALTGMTIAESDLSTREFSAGAAPVFPAQLDTGGQVTIEVVYTPHAERADVGSITVSSALRTATVPLLGTGGPSICLTSPAVANAGAELTARPLQMVSLDGRASSSPRGISTYSWRIVTQPTNGTSSITGSGPRPQLYAQLAGDYTLELVVTDSGGCQSAPATTKVHVVPDKRVHLQLTWPQGFGDNDLHYVKPGGAFWDNSTDTFFKNTSASWGATLDIDAMWGNGPENINHQTPAAGTYPVYVHYYCSRGCALSVFGVCVAYGSSYGKTNPLLKLYVDGVEKWSGTKQLSEQDRWNPINVTVSGGTIGFQAAGAVENVPHGCTVEE